MSLDRAPSVLSESVCYLDLDGVLADFTAAAIEVHGLGLAHADVKTWDFHLDIGFGGDRESDFWEPMGYDFWANLPKTQEHDAVLAAVKGVFGDRVVIVTSPARTHGCLEGKATWVRKHLPEFSNRLLFLTSKHLVAGPSKVLVDDYEFNTDQFERHGGRSVLFPRLYNSRHQLAPCGHFADMDVFRDWLIAAST